MYNTRKAFGCPPARPGFDICFLNSHWPYTLDREIIAMQPHLCQRRRRFGDGDSGSSRISCTIKLPSSSCRELAHLTKNLASHWSARRKKRKWGILYDIPAPSVSIRVETPDLVCSGRIQTWPREVQHGLETLNHLKGRGHIGCCKLSFLSSPHFSRGDLEDVRVFAASERSHFACKLNSAFL